ncbi:hypothetical protein GCM10009785_29580 [Brooklawnia cerclae]|uniref:TIGR02611 family protein n=1 Tax=Brooklawnia cerclae TaxID=349934 RepID=A0ABX0SJ32_9ACTN|nr:PGPGW domain-containing protein [Brooklawnia cerclae]NIH56751.1 hypothetical protein [Brooklawnia cerclae]
MSEPVEVHGATPSAHQPPDRLAWRVRLKSHPVGRTWFRIAVGVIGAVLIIAAPLTGWLPGPGGIPLFLAGMAVLASEFMWAKRLRRLLLRYVHIYLLWPSKRRRLFWVAFFVGLGLLWWVSLVIVGVPGWIPEPVTTWLRFLPGVR